MTKLSKGALIELKIDDLAFGGAGVGRKEGLVVFVRGAAAGERVRARVFKSKSNHAEADLVEVLSPSPQRVEAPCPYFGVCGGCSWQHITYAAQLEAKRSIVAQSLAHIGGLKELLVQPILPSPAEWRYRNKMDLTFGLAPDGAPALGFHRPNDYKRILDINACLIQPECFDRAVQTCKRFVLDRNLTCCDPVTHQGLMRHLMLRHSVASGEMLAVVTSATPPRESAVDFADLAQRLREACPEMRAFIWGANDNVADVMRVERVLHKEGEDCLEELLGETRFRISSNSFFQTNTRAARVLYDAIADCLDLDSSKTVLDAYCGTGSIGIYCAARAKAVWGLELVKEAVWDARNNAALNGLSNCRFIAGDIRQTLRLALEGMGGGGRPDCVIVDPPRGGMHKKALDGLVQIGAPVFVYVSCNPTTLARDLTEIGDAGYRLTRVQPVDLFPQNYHVETVCRFER
ncbi:MAG: 23S rRNA (uracil(1939)-C(5))-methyltransferase RlmD [Candidatus Sumerlaeota bacterium]|nr:23S rRNA (uracil(1939)-C(5))-methyltransferase RlmD [Candidatus Sumerlaeota bacterium]